MLDLSKAIPLRVIGADFKLVAEIDAFRSLQFTLNHYKPGQAGDFSAETMAGSNGTDELDDGAIVMLGQDGSRAAFINSVNEDESTDGRVLKVAGPHISSMVGWRLTAPPAGLDYWRMTGDLETYFKALVADNCTTPTDPARVVPGLTLAPNQHRGPVVTVEARYVNLADKLTELATVYDMGWGVVVDWLAGAYVFDVYPGTDRSRGNVPGNSPVVFSYDMNNLITKNRQRSTGNYRNVAWVGGQGEGAARAIVAVGSAAGAARREIFIDARDVDDTALLPARGSEKLAAENSATDVMNIELQPSGSFVLDVDFFTGDRVTVEDAAQGWQLPERIIETTVGISDKGINLGAKVGKDLPTIQDFIKRQAPKA